MAFCLEKSKYELKSTCVVNYSLGVEARTIAVVPPLVNNRDTRGDTLYQVITCGIPPSPRKGGCMSALEVMAAVVLAALLLQMLRLVLRGR